MPTQDANAQTLQETSQQALITVGIIPPDDDLGMFVDDAPGTPNVWTDYAINNKYNANDLQTLMMPVASPNGFQGDTVAFVDLAGDTLLWVCDWTAARFGEQPQVPDPYSVESKWVLMKIQDLETSMLTVGPDAATPLYRISGTYVFGHRRPSANVFSDINYARPPWLADAFNRTMPLSELTRGLMDQGGGSSPSSPGNVGG